MFPTLAPHQVARLTTVVGPVVPPVLGVVSAVLAISAIAAWMRLTPASEPGSALALAVTAVAMAVFSVGMRYAATKERVELAVATGLLATMGLNWGICAAAYYGSFGIGAALPYCLLVFLCSAFFLVHVHYLVLSAIGCFGPPAILLGLTSPTAVEAWMAIISAAITIAVGSGLYFFLQHSNRQLYVLTEELKHHATYDSLTGVLNRRAWVYQAQARLAEDQRRGLTTACLFIDLDGFKLINDTEGHGAGDAFLIKVAEVLAKLANPPVLLGRLGGDEFVLLLPGTDFDKSVRLPMMSGGNYPSCVRRTRWSWPVLAPPCPRGR